jgi:hypothetical protein
MSSDWWPAVVMVRAGSSTGVIISAPPSLLRINSPWWLPLAATVPNGESGR